MADVIFHTNSEQVTVVCSNLNIQGNDLILDKLERRKPLSPKYRRAMVHDFDDSLAINYSKDYPSGVTIQGPVSISGDLVLNLEYEVIEVDLDRAHHYPPPIVETVSMASFIAELKKEIENLKTRISNLEGGA